MKQSEGKAPADLFQETDFGAEDKNSLSYHLSQMDSKTTEILANELRESYMQLKDLSSRCMIDMEQISKADSRVFYFKPNSVYLEDPEKQRQYRQRFTQAASSLREPNKRFGVADQLDAEARALVDQALSDPEQVRTYLADFFERRVYHLQHKKYKMLTRWAHFALTSESIDRIGSQGTFTYGRVEYEIENALKRHERLAQKDGYADLRDGKIQRPQTKEVNDLNKGGPIDRAQDKEDNLGDRSKDPISCIRLDDFEIYFRIQSYNNKIFRPMQKFIARGKWVSTSKNLEIFKEMHIRYKELQEESYKEQVEHVKIIKERFNNSMMKKTDDLTVQMEEVILEDYPAQRIFLENKITSQAQNGQKTSSKMIPKYEVVVERCPSKLQNLLEMQERIERMASAYQINGNVEIDNGFSFTYQVQVFFTVYYQKLVIESCYGRYNQLARDPQESTVTASKAMDVADGRGGAPFTTFSRGLKTHTSAAGPMDGAAQTRTDAFKEQIEKLYEQYDADFAHDFSEIQKRNLKSLLLVDFLLVDLQNTNADGSSLPLLKKGKKINEQIPDLQKLFGDVKIVRLKKATWVEGQVMISPSISESQKKQQAALGNNFAADLQLSSLLDFLDISDPSMVNSLYQSIAKLYEKMARNEYSINYLVEDVEMGSEQFTDAVAKRFHESFKKTLKGNFNENSHKSRIDPAEVQRLKDKRFVNQDRTIVDTTHSELRKLPLHIVQCYLTLKHLRMRDAKNKLLQILNFFRSVQKRIVLELKEFARREVINNQVRIKPPEEAFYISQKATSLEENFQNMGIGKPHEEPADRKSQAQKAEELMLDEDEEIATLLDLKKWKYKGQFSNRYLSTCPQPVTVDSRYGRPFEEPMYQPNHNMLRQTKKHISEQSKAYLNRIDTYKINEELKSIEVIDDYGITVMYDATLQDMVVFEKELLQIGTHYIKKNELDFDFEKFEYALVDRGEVLQDLLELEMEYQFLKAQIVLAYVDALEHTCDIVTQQRLMQVIVDVMAWRPQLDYQRSWYFEQSYKAATRYLRTLLKILKEAVAFQMENESAENRKIKDYLVLSFKMADAYRAMAWSDVEQDQIKNEIKERRYVQGGKRQEAEDADGEHESERGEDPIENPVIEEYNAHAENRNKDSLASKMADGADAIPSAPGRDQLDAKGQRSKGASRSSQSGSKGGKKTFVEQLGIKAPDLKDQMLAQAALDPVAEDAIEQDASFIKSQEGYPAFFRSVQDSLSNVLFSNGTSEYSCRPFGVLDFYDSLMVLPNIHALILQGQSELKNDLKPAGAVQETLMNTIYLEKLYVELVKTQDQRNGNGQQQYKAQKELESDLVVSNPDKVVFLVKDMIATINKQFKKSMNPFWIAKMDLNSINHFAFPEMPSTYFQDNDVVDVNFSRNFTETQLQPKSSHQAAHFFPRLKDDDKKINAPPMLLVFCNLVELLRMRENLILCLAETQLLDECFRHQKQLVHQDSLQTSHQQHLNIQCVGQIDHDKVNFIEHGSLLMKMPKLDSGLAIDEVCPTLRSMLNFQNPECVQMMTLDGGLQNVAATVHYQLMQKQLLQTAVQQNSFMLSPFLKGICEIELLIEYGIKMPNGLIDLSKLQVGPKKMIDADKVKKLKSHFNSQMLAQADSFAQVNKHKTDMRLKIKKAWDLQFNRLNSLGYDKKPHPEFKNRLPSPLNQFTKIRLMHDYKISLVHIGCREIHKSILTNALKLELLYLHGQLKQKLNYSAGLRPEYQLFQMEMSHGQDVDPAFLQMETLKTDTDVLGSLYEKGEEAIPQDCTRIIPSMQSIVKLQPFTKTKEKLMLSQPDLFEKNLDRCQYSDFNLNLLIYKNLSSQFDLENRAHAFSRHLFKREIGKDGASLYQLDIVKNHSLIGKVLQIYEQVLILFEFQYYSSRVNIKPIDNIEMQNAADQNRHFWRVDEAAQVQKVEIPGEEPLEEDREQKTYAIEDEGLNAKIVDKVATEIRTQQAILEEIQNLGKNFQAVTAKINKQIKAGCKLDGLLQYLKDSNRISQMKIFKSQLLGLDMLVQQNNASQVQYQTTMDTIKLIGGYDMCVPFFLNGLILNSKIFLPRTHDIQSTIGGDFDKFKRTVQGLKFSEDLVNMNCALVSSLIDPMHQERDLEFNYVGQLHVREGLITTDLRSCFIGLSEKQSMAAQSAFHSQEAQFQNLLKHEDMGHFHYDHVNATQLTQILQNQISGLMLKFIYMMMLAGKSFQRFFDHHSFNRDFVAPYASNVNWRIAKYYDAEQKKKKEEEEKAAKVKQKASSLIITKSKEQATIEAKDGVDRAIRSDIVAKSAPQTQVKIKQANNIQLEEAMRIYLKQQCQRRVLQIEIDKLLMQAGIVAMDNQVAAISKSLEMCSNRIDKHVPSQQRFCATLFDSVNRHQHLEISSKLGSIQVFLTKMRNRGLPTKTLTSGLGIVFTFKDLNECMHDFCSEMMLFGEKQLKQRTDAHLAQIEQLKEIIQYKDLKIDAMKLRCAHVFDNIQRVANSKVLEQGNALVFALDKSMREVRFFQDHIRSYESELRTAIHQEFRLLLAEQGQAMSSKDKTIKDMHERMVHTVNDLIIKEQLRCNEAIKKKAQQLITLDDLKIERKEQPNDNSSKVQTNGQRRKIMGSNQKKNNASVVEVERKRLNQQKEEDSMVIKPEDATRVIMMLQQRLVRQRTFWAMRHAVTKDKLEEQIVFLENKLSSNVALWQSMKVQDQRQKVLQQELSITQHSAQQNEKLIGKLKDEFKSNQKGMQILESLQQAKTNKLNELQYKVKKMELNKNVNVEKLIEILMQQNKEIEELKAAEAYQKNRLKMADNDFETKKLVFKRQIQQEMELKNQSMAKVEELNSKIKIYELQNTKTGSEKIGSVYKAKFEEMFGICQNLMQENKQLKMQIQLSQNAMKQKTDLLADDQVSQTTKTSASQYGLGATLDQGNLFMKKQLSPNLNLDELTKMNRPYQSAHQQHDDSKQYRNRSGLHQNNAYVDSKGPSLQESSPVRRVNGSAQLSDFTKSRHEAKTKSVQGKGQAQSLTTSDNQYTEAMSKMINKHKLGAANQESKSMASLMIRRKQMQSLQRPGALQESSAQSQLVLNAVNPVLLRDPQGKEQIHVPSINITQMKKGTHQTSRGDSTLKREAPSIQQVANSDLNKSLSNGFGVVGLNKK